MNTKLKKSLNIAAAAVFMVGLAINVQMSLDDPFSNVNAVALAQQTGSGGSGDDGGTDGGTAPTSSGWFWKEVKVLVKVTESTGGSIGGYVVGSGGTIAWDGTSEEYEVWKDKCIDGWSACGVTHWW